MKRWLIASLLCLPHLGSADEAPKPHLDPSVDLSREIVLSPEKSIRFEVKTAVGSYHLKYDIVSSDCGPEPTGDFASEVAALSYSYGYVWTKHPEPEKFGKYVEIPKFLTGNLRANAFSWETVPLLAQRFHFHRPKVEMSGAAFQKLSPQTTNSIHLVNVSSSINVQNPQTEQLENLNFSEWTNAMLIRDGDHFMMQEFGSTRGFPPVTDFIQWVFESSPNETCLVHMTLDLSKFDKESVPKDIMDFSAAEYQELFRKRQTITDDLLPYYLKSLNDLIAQGKIDDLQ